MSVEDLIQEWIWALRFQQDRIDQAAMQAREEARRAALTQVQRDEEDALVWLEMRMTLNGIVHRIVA